MNKEKFIKEISKLNIVLTTEQEEKLDKYYHILIEENQKYNLTAITEEEDVYLKHFYDSLTLTKIINLDNQSICDMGTGAGFPGLVLAICFPKTKLTLIEANTKKCNFLNIVKERLFLDNVTIINARIEEFAKNNREVFDIVTARAVAPLKHLLEYGTPLVKVNGYLIPMKGKESTEGLNNYLEKLNISIEEVIIFNLPIEESERTLIKFKKIKITNTKYPRRYSEIKKKEL